MKRRLFTILSALSLLLLVAVVVLWVRGLFPAAPPPPLRGNVR